MVSFSEDQTANEQPVFSCCVATRLVQSNAMHTLLLAKHDFPNMHCTRQAE